jgi:hypothetical protein
MLTQLSSAELLSVPVQPPDAVACLVVKVGHLMHPHQQQVGVPAAANIENSIE